MLTGITLALTTVFIGKRKGFKGLHMYASMLEYWQLLFFLTYFSVGLPSLMETLFYSFRFAAGNLVVSAILGSSGKGGDGEGGVTELMLSPGQFYKRQGDMHLFRNLADVAILLGVVFIVLAFMKILNKFTSIKPHLTSKMLQKSILAVKALLWTFTPAIAFYSFCNIFYHPSSPKYLSTLQTSLPYLLTTYIVSILSLLTPIYFFYHQYSSKTYFDKGIN